MMISGGYDALQAQKHWMEYFLSAMEVYNIMNDHSVILN